MIICGDGFLRTIHPAFGLHEDLGTAEYLAVQGIIGDRGAVRRHIDGEPL